MSGNSKQTMQPNSSLPVPPLPVTPPKDVRSAGTSDGPYTGYSTGPIAGRDGYATARSTASARSTAASFLANGVSPTSLTSGVVKGRAHTRFAPKACFKGRNRIFAILILPKAGPQARIAQPYVCIQRLCVRWCHSLSLLPHYPVLRRLPCTHSTNEYDVHRF